VQLNLSCIAHIHVFGVRRGSGKGSGSGLTKDLWPWRLYNYGDGKVLLGFLVSVFGL